MDGTSISMVARRTGFTPATLRYYESIDLIHPARSPTGYRRYAADDIETLQFIGRAKRLGLSLDEIRRLLDARQRGDCASTRRQLAALVKAHLADVRRLGTELKRLQHELEEVHRRLSDAPAPGRCASGCGCDIEPEDDVATRHLGGLATLTPVHQRAHRRTAAMSTTPVPRR